MALLLANAGNDNCGLVGFIIGPCVATMDFCITGDCVTITGLFTVGRSVTGAAAMACGGRCTTEPLDVITFDGGRIGLPVGRGKISLDNSSAGDSTELSGFFFVDSDKSDKHIPVNQ